MEQVKKLDYSSFAIGRIWMKVPLVVRSILIGLCVSSLGVWTWVFLVSYVPFLVSVLLMGGFLFLYWTYFSGRWRPASTQAFRRSCMRQMTLKKHQWIWGLTAAVTIIMLLHGGFILTFRMNEFQPEIFKTAIFLNDLPAWTAWPIIIMASSVAGICEEIGFRGFMQKPLEEKYGPIIGISITSIVFVVVHLHQAWASGILVGIFAVSFILGYLAYSTNSLIPGIIAHVSFDIINFSYWWSDVVGTFDRKPIGMTGIDSHFIITVAVLLLSSVLFIVAIWKLMNLRRRALKNL